MEKLTEGRSDAIFAVAPGGESLSWTAGAAPMAGGQKGKTNREAEGPKS